MKRQYEVVERVLAYDPSANEALLDRAYVYATKMHGRQRRASGDPYFSHPVEVAGILADMKADSTTIATALLHDVIEDTEATREDVQELFGEEIASLVDGVTKLAYIDLKSEVGRTAENFRKFLLATSDDIRVLLVKLADRLHNMRTLEFVDEQKRRRIAQETMDIYAPLAGRMGMQGFREEMEDLAFRTLNPEARDMIVTRLEEVLSDRGQVIASIENLLTEKLSACAIEAQVRGREKRPYSIWHKMQRQSIALEQLSDLIGFRILVPDRESCYRALGVAHMTWPMVPGRFKDYISTPKANGYRSLHSTLVGPEQQRVEIQIHTPNMSALAEYGIAAHWLYKEDIPPAEAEMVSKPYRWLRQVVKMMEHGDTPEEFLEHTRLEMFSSQVFCFTPKGGLIVLPREATPLDFAYAVHTDVGNQCFGVRVNGGHASLRTRLQNGDEVEILTSSEAGPSPVWINFVVTGRARYAIRRALRQTREGQMARAGRQILENAFTRMKRKISDKVLKRATEVLELEDVETLYKRVGAGELSGSAVVRAVYPRAIQRRRKAHGLPIRGLLPGMNVHFAPDTFPLPGDNIVGILTPKKGIVVYPVESRALEQFSDDSDRWLNVSWEETGQTMFVGRVELTLVNAPGTLGMVTTLIGKFEANIVNLTVAERHSDSNLLHIDMEVGGRDYLDKIIMALRGLSVVGRANRVVCLS